MSAERPGALVLDAGVLIGHLDADDPHHMTVEALLSRHLGMRLCATALTVAECLVRPAFEGGAALAERALNRLGLERVALDGADAGALATVRAETRLRMPEAAVVHTAERLDAAIATTDRTLARAARARGLVVHVP